MCAVFHPRKRRVEMFREASTAGGSGAPAAAGRRDLSIWDGTRRVWRDAATCGGAGPSGAVLRGGCACVRAARGGIRESSSPCVVPRRIALTGVPVAAGAATASIVVIKVFPCNNAGTVSVPAGSTIVMNLNWSEPSEGLINEWVAARSTTAAVNGVDAANADALWSTPFEAAPNIWLSKWFLNTGVTLRGHQSMSFSFEVTLSQRVGPDPAGPAPGVLSCIITAE